MKTLFGVLILCSSSALASPGQTFLVDQALIKKLHSAGQAGPWAAEKKLTEFEERLRNLEARIVKTASERKTRQDQIDQILAVLDSQHVLLNPYTNATWLEKAKKVAHRFCCRLKSDRIMADAVVDNIQAGKPPIDGFKEKFPVSE